MSYIFKYVANPVQITNGATSARLDPETLIVVIIAKIHEISSTRGAIILGPQVLSGSHAQQAIKVAMNNLSKSLPTRYQATPVVTYKIVQTVPNTQLGGARGTRLSTLLIRPHRDEEIAEAVEMERAGAKRRSIFVLTGNYNFILGKRCKNRENAAKNRGNAAKIGNMLQTSVKCCRNCEH